MFNGFSKLDDAFKAKMAKQIEGKFDLIDKREIKQNVNIEVFFILLPLADVGSIKEKLEAMEAVFA